MTAESSSTKLSEPKASNAGLWAATAPASETPHSTTIQANVTACSHTMRCLTSAGDKHCALLNPACGSPIWTNCDMAPFLLSALRGALSGEWSDSNSSESITNLSTWASSLYGNRLLSPSADNEWSSLQPRAGKARRVPAPGVESWSPCGVQTPKSRPVASTGVHEAW